MKKPTKRHLMPILWAAALLLSACAGAAAPTLTPTPLPSPTPEVAIVTIERDPDVPELPFPDNPDPLQCGIPIQWGNSDNRAWLNGIYEGEMVQPEVLLYDSHLRHSVVTSAPHGAEVEIVLYQPNPVLDFYMVRIVGAEGEGLREGWVPAPFLSFQPINS